MKPEVASRRIEAFGQRFGEAHLYLAYHAAFPLALTPDLLYRLWANFQLDINGELLNIPWMAVADLLLSSLCDEVGHELYEMDKVVRNVLLTELKVNSRFGEKRIHELSDFLLAYVRQQIESHDPDIRDFAQAQKWAALAYTQPGEAAHELALALSELKLEDKAEWVRMASLVETFAEPLAEFQPLLIYARGMANFILGNLQSATAQIASLLAHQEPRLHIAGVNLLIPELVASSDREVSPITQFSTNQPSSESFKTDRLLVIDDSPDNCFLVKTILEEEGYQVEIAESGSSALYVIEASPPDLILLDLMMPGMDGYEVTRRIRQNTALPFIPILIITAHDSPKVAQALDLGADDFIRKPVTVDELQARVRSLLRLKHSIHQLEKTVRGLETDTQKQPDLLQRQSRRSLWASKEGIQLAKNGLAKRSWTQKYLASMSYMSISTVNKFFRGLPIDRGNFVYLCESLDLNWQEVAQPQGTIAQTSNQPNEYTQGDRSFQNLRKDQPQLVNEQLGKLIREVLQHPIGSIERQKAMIKLKQSIDSLPELIEYLEYRLHK